MCVGAPRAAKARSNSSSVVILGIPPEAEPNDLGMGQTGLREARQPARDRDREPVYGVVRRRVAAPTHAISRGGGPGYSGAGVTRSRNSYRTARLVRLLG